MAREAIGVKRYVVRLTSEERPHLDELTQATQNGSLARACHQLGLDPHITLQIPKIGFA
jgi:hypothetical protein